MDNSVYYTIFNIFIYCALAAFVLYLPRAWYFFSGFKKQRHVVNTVKNRLAVIVPARNESAGITLLLESLARQTYDHSLFDTYIVVDSASDPTVGIAGRYAHTSVKVVEHQTCKGMALDGILSELNAQRTAGTQYAGYIIVDADNFVADNFIEEMNNSLALNCQVVLGKREVKNWKIGGRQYRSWAANCNGLIYSIIDKLGNAYRTKHGIPCMMCGTGVLVRADVIAEIGGWPYRSLTEDLEMTVNCIIHGWTSCFYEYAVTNTEEPLSLKTADMRRGRWCGGYIQNTFAYRRLVVKKTFSSLYDTSLSPLQRIAQIRWENFDFLYSLFPPILFFADVFVALVIYAVLFVRSLVYGTPAGACLYCGAEVAGVLYGVLFIYTLIALASDWKSVTIPVREKCAVLFGNPLYFARYFDLYIAAFFKFCSRSRNAADGIWTPVDRIEQPELSQSRQKRTVSWISRR